VSSGQVDERVAHGWRVVIDRSLCVGFGDCVAAAPEAFALDDEQVVIFVHPEHVEAQQLLLACQSCPVDALSVLDATGTLLVP
jgi:ferredoxin